MAFTKIVLTDPQIRAAWAVAKQRTLKYGNDPWNQIIGALGEVAVAEWAIGNGMDPVDDAFKDPARDAGADLYLGPPRFSVDVKSSCDGDAYVYPERQVAALKNKAAGIVWCGVYPQTSDWNFTGFEVLVLGWSTAQDVFDATLVSPMGRDPYRVVSLPVRDLAALRVAAQ